MRKRLEDAVYDREIERMANLAGFPHLPAAQLEYRRVLRRITEMDKEFLHNLITDLIDSTTVCPTPADLIQLAGAKRQRASQTVANVDCPHCQGLGYITVTRQVRISRLEPYDADFARPCQCRGKA